MSLRRFFINPAEITGETAQLTGPEAHHLRAVLRLGPGDPLTIFDGTGARYQARVEQIRKDRVTANIIEQTLDPLPRVRLHLGQALLDKGQKMDLILQKATELGVDEIWLFFSEYGGHKSPAISQIERWQRIIIEACKQCDRARVPQLHAPIKLIDLISQPPCDTRLIFWEHEKKQSLTEALADQGEDCRAAFFLIGPVGGFSEQEVAHARREGFKPVSLGPRILRAETATIAATAIMQYALGNLNPAPRENQEPTPCAP